MRMKKWMAWMLSAILTLAAVLPLSALAEEAVPDTELEGFVTELVEGGFIMEDKEIGQVLLNVDDTTVLDGVLAENEIAVGQYVIVQYDGRLTRSIPPQAHADRVGCYVLNGTVGEFLENGFLLTGDALFGDVIVHMEGTIPHVYLNVPVTVYYDGIMALSMPGQIVARQVIVPELTGTVSGKDEKGFTLTGEDGVSYLVHLTETTLVGELLPAEPEADDADAAQDEAAAEPAEGEDESETDAAADAEGKTQTEPGADEVEEPADAGEGVPATPSDEVIDNNAVTPGAEAGIQEETPTQPAVELKDGDTVTVYFNGIVSRSIPAQLTALEVLVLR